MTTKAKHTPGPWHTKGTLVLVSPRLIIAEIDRGGKAAETATANARLIALAPEMAEALSALASSFECCLRSKTSAAVFNEVTAINLQFASSILAKLEGGE